MVGFTTPKNIYVYMLVLYPFLKVVTKDLLLENLLGKQTVSAMRVELPFLQVHVSRGSPMKTVTLSGMGQAQVDNCSMREDSRWNCRSALDSWVSFYFLQTEVTCALASTEREFSHLIWLQEGQKHTPYFTWRCPDGIPPYLFLCYNLLYSS